MFGSGRSAERPVQMFFSLSYYGYHNPERIFGSRPPQTAYPNQDQLPRWGDERSI